MTPLPMWMCSEAKTFKDLVQTSIHNLQGLSGMFTKSWLSLLDGRTAESAGNYVSSG
jgi:hypothetical protein